MKKRGNLDFPAQVQGEFKGQDVNGSLRGGNGNPGWNKDWRWPNEDQVTVEGPGPWTNANRTGE
jgi:hypothetical protein